MENWGKVFQIKTIAYVKAPKGGLTVLEVLVVIQGIATIPSWDHQDWTCILEESLWLQVGERGGKQDLSLVSRVKTVSFIQKQSCVWSDKVLEVERKRCGGELGFGDLEQIGI